MYNLALKIVALLKSAVKRWFSPSGGNWLNLKEPISRVFGLDRGSAIDRKFMEHFLSLHKKYIRGNVLEIGDDQYTYKYGRSLIRSTILAGPESSPRSECYPQADLTDERILLSEKKFDCIIATNVLNFIYEVDLAVRGLASLVEPVEGTVLVTVAGLSQVSRFDYDRWGDYWRFNDMSMLRLFEKYFYDVEVISYGNAPIAAAFIMGLSQEEVPRQLFEHHDPDYQVLVGIRASKPKAKLP